MLISNKVARSPSPFFKIVARNSVTASKLIAATEARFGIGYRECAGEIFGEKPEWKVTF
jgi:hypothetical protein